ncbi:autotransporter outer membrane beta-barrel domain-containing protein [Guyparkeria halophila]|uniref:Autotransporter outer membrane beta-barrel domain-containing protein n=1 Tax=Guyparkeria halophila TaxID=47960 RepID=A0ABZ0Z133_9GAMM|nr:autotransporter outer membrane beta-barrel domain-containing protein [Guyparkeria halophila]WQH17126.1 autotransporter outer membrane beta-barrel domain-containing protein [Guyparkeria halophila]
MTKKSVGLGLAAILFSASGTVVAAESEQTQRLKQLLEGIESGQIDPKLRAAFVENRLTPKEGTIGAWIDYRHSELEDQRRDVGKTSDSDSYAVGIDYRITARTVIGISLLEQDTETRSDPSDGATRGYSVIDDDTRGIGLYGMHMLDSGVSIDAAITYLQTDSDITDFSTLAPPSQKSTDGSSVVLDIGASAFYPLNDRLWASGRAAFSYIHGEQDSYQDEFDRRQDNQDYEVGTASINANLNYAATDAIVPYAGINLGYDVFSDAGAPALVRNPGGSIATAVPFQDERNRLSYGFQLGINWHVMDNLTMRAGYQRQQWGSDLFTDTVGANLRYVF